MNIKNMFKNLNVTIQKGTTEQKIIYLEKKYNWILPDFYKKILIFSDGIEIEDDVMDIGISLFGINDLIEWNEEVYKTTQYTPDLLLIGNTGGDEVLGVEQKKDSKKKYIYGDAGAVFPGEESITIIHIEKWFLNGCPMGEELYKCIY